MALRRTRFYLALVGAFLLSIIVCPSCVTSFTVTPSRVVRVTKTPPPRRLHRSTSTADASPTSLRMTNPRNEDTYGFRQGRYLLLVVAIINVWIFSIPTEFRRARFCSEEDVRLYPERKCTTFKMWREDIAEYYSKGGGVNFDFTVEGRE